MTDVRLTATNPEDSSVVPVACNAKGELKLEEPITPPGFDGNLEGDLNVLGSASFANAIQGRNVYTINTLSATLPNLTAYEAYASQADFDNTNSPSVQILSSGSANFAGAVTTTGGSADGQSNKLFGTYGIQVDSGTSTGGYVFQGMEDGTETSRINSDGSATFKGNVFTDAALGSNNGNAFVYISATPFNDPLNYIFGHWNGSEYLSSIGQDGSATFAGDVVIGSKGKQWLIRESNGVAMLIEETRRGAKEPRLEEVRDLPRELDLVEAALNEIMGKLRMTPPAGWPVWDGSDNSAER